ncbi:hypothetical protein AB0K12_48065 [Nonomuraea sp. NPDC049419]|uniref:rhamnogalacturonan lyase family protein n=1 Tax=Nonomuraea sp. NPDC049419 TaxID=3155772 RepID=UPI003428C66C
MTTRHRRGRPRRLTTLIALTGLALGAVTAPAASDAVPGPAPHGDAAGKAGARVMERLDRGVVAVRSGEKEVLVSWRLLGLDPEGIGFDVERSTDGGPYRKLNRKPLTGGTNYVDATADLGKLNRYRIRPVIDRRPQPPSKPFALSAGHAVEPVVRVPLRAGGPVKFVWVGDLDGDGAYDYVLDRQTAPQKIEAYRSDGTFLWEMDLGPNSMEQDNIEGGSSTVDVGHNDGVTVYDLDSDGQAEVAIRIANGVTFGDGRTFTAGADDTAQFMAIVDGRTGRLRASAPVPGDYTADGPMYARFGVGYLDGKTPSLVAYMKNRIGNGDFNLMESAWRFDGRSLRLQWKFLRGDQNLPDGHNTRIVDVDGDGRDEVGEIGFVLNGDGTLRYSLAPQGVRHGDRWFIADIDPGRPGLEGYGIQQDHPDGLLDYYYDARTGSIIWKHSSALPADAGRGMVADIDPRHPGMEVWSINGEVNYEQGRPTGLYNAATNRLTEPDTTKQPWPHMGVWWDGDPLRELFNADPFPDRRDARIEKWDPANPAPPPALPRLVTTSAYGAVTANGNAVYPHLVADIFGDWREEVVLTSPDYDELVIFTTDRPSDIRLYTLAHNPAYRNGMTLKGYLQSSNVDYFLGHGMTTPPRPKIRYAGR